MNKSKKNSFYMITLSIFLISLLFIRYAQSFFNYNIMGVQNVINPSNLYVYLHENEDEFLLNNVYPLSKEEARSRDDNILSFTVDAKNTSSSSIAYNILLKRGDDDSERIRFKDKDLRFDLSRINENEQEELILDAVSFDDIDNKVLLREFVEANLNHEVQHKYNLRMWLSDTVLISDTDSNADYKATGNQAFNKHYASIKIAVDAQINTSYTINFHPNYDGASETMSSQVILINKPQKLKKNVFTKEEATFLHWNTKPDGSGISFFDEQIVDNRDFTSGIVDLYAQYKPFVTSYFMKYNGESDGVLGFTNSTITSFARNTSLSKAEVLAKSNVRNVTNTLDDGNLSTYDVYAWTETNDSGEDLYWWSEADLVYFHPETLKGFKDCVIATNIDLNGTSTIKVENFAHWFDKNRKLKFIYGQIRTDGLKLQYNNSYDYANEESGDDNKSSGYGFAFMFNDCNELVDVDLSRFVTTNASDMKRMFGGCNSIKELNLSHFDTKNVKSMYWMFRNNRKLNYLDLSSFDTSNLNNAYGMMINCSNIKSIILGDKFDTSNVKIMINMFYGLSSLKTIYASRDFVLNSSTKSSSMFKNDTLLVGGANKEYETAYNSSNTNGTYAKIASSNQSGYFTSNSERTSYTITYVLDGGTTTNPSVYYAESNTFSLTPVVKEGYTFIGWTGSNGDVPQSIVTINQGTTGNKTYVANYTEGIDLFPKVFEISGKCNFDGSNGSITGNDCKGKLYDNTVINYVGKNYIDTEINLYNASNYLKDYEIYFELSNYAPSSQDSGESKQTIMNSKLENQSLNYPGIVFRRLGDDLELKHTINNTTESVSKAYASVKSVRIFKRNNKVYYSFNNDNLTLLQDMSDFSTPFDLSVWFGAAKDANGNAFRNFRGTLSNIYIKLGTYTE